MSILVTGSAGFIGYHVCQTLLGRGERVIGVDNLNDYYDPALKQARLDRLTPHRNFAFHRTDVSDREAMPALFEANPDIEGVIHLAAQAGVRYSLINPYAYIEANVMGQVVMMEACRRLPNFKHLVYASSSSVYGSNTDMPFSVTDRVDNPISLYAATKRSAELSASCYAHLFGLPMTGLRFFTVYGPWGRPDMSAFLFASAIFEGRPIEVFNNGEMRRDFTYIDDIVAGVIAALDHPPEVAAGDGAGNGAGNGGGNGLERPHRVYNLGNNNTVELMRFIEIIEQECGRPAEKIFKGMQPGDVKETYADIEASQRDLGFDPRTTIDEGLPKFIAWYREYHQV